MPSEEPNIFCLIMQWQTGTGRKWCFLPRCLMWGWGGVGEGRYRVRWPGGGRSWAHTVQWSSPYITVCSTQHLGFQKLEAVVKVLKEAAQRYRVTVLAKHRYVVQEHLLLWIAGWDSVWCTAAGLLTDESYSTDRCTVGLCGCSCCALFGSATTHHFCQALKLTAEKQRVKNVAGVFPNPSLCP